ncbi:hypothetical protein BAUCODRAFT_195547 [Baudoinia panamericana UAMH 10762]|uniref:Uncharacterized protein n=1 Tax=Baudoinia panamericana (strain UAMH 10762) TaxID=717646 RepID=M2M1Z3_BAUPA|nr:uncharacterized protein BAUCODRAFT_195547 [Baudoinia panamericana UAMH 10762]EMD01088.1 hypothetical protein BAUCODRAFT_195547 [Baudoinia panamericana UAMH 10762]
MVYLQEMCEGTASPRAPQLRSRRETLRLVAQGYYGRMIVPFRRLFFAPPSTCTHWATLPTRVSRQKLAAGQWHPVLRLACPRRQFNQPVIKRRAHPSWGAVGWPSGVNAAAVSNCGIRVLARSIRPRRPAGLNDRSPSPSDCIAIGLL